MKRLPAAGISTAVGIGWGLVLCFFLFDEREMSGIMHWLLGSFDWLMTNPVFLVVFFLYNAVIAGVVVYQVLTHRIYIPFWYVCTIQYCVFTFIIVMFKTHGVSGVNFDLSQGLTEITDTPFTMLLNFVAFVPIGMIFGTFGKSVLRSSSIVLTFILICETAQYIFHFGVFDIIDIILDMCGFILGFFTILTFKRIGYGAVREKNTYIIKRYKFDYSD